MKLDLIASLGFENAKEEAVMSDASLRSRVRLIKGNESIIVTQYPTTPQYPEKVEESKKDILAFIRISKYLLKNGLSAPKVIDYDLESGIVLEEDFGSGNIFSVIAETDHDVDTKLYTRAVDVLLHLHALEPLEGLPTIKRQDFTEWLWVFANWGLSFYGNNDSESKLEYVTIWENLMKEGYTRDVVALGDYHSPNLMWLSAREGVKAVGIIDFQNAFIGSKAYDLVSLARDARYFVNTKLYQNLLEYYMKFSGMSKFDREDFMNWCYIIGVYRTLRTIGLFAYKNSQLKDGRYVRYIPILESYVSSALSEPILSPVKDFFKRLKLTSNPFFKSG